MSHLTDDGIEELGRKAAESQAALTAHLDDLTGTGEARILPPERAGMTATSELVVSHRRALDNVFVYSLMLATGAEHVQATARSHFDYAISQCHAHIENRVPASELPNGVAARFARTHEWSQQPELLALWNAYLAGGHIRADGPVPYDSAVVTSPDDGAVAVDILPLEAAVINGNTDCLLALLAAGADPTLVPSLDWSTTPNTRNHGGAVVDVYTFIAAKIPQPQLAPTMAAAVTEALMLRRLRAAAPPRVDVEPGRRRRVTV